MSILIVEDNESFRGSLRQLLLALFPSRRISEALTGEESVSMAIAEPPDLIIMDIHLPGINGLEAARLIKQALPGIPVVILSVYEEESYRVEAAAVGVSEFIPKSRAATRLVPALTTLLAV